MSKKITDDTRPRGKRKQEVVAHIAAAWTDPGPNPAWHYRSKQDVRRLMPLLGKYLDELTGENR